MAGHPQHTQCAVHKDSQGVRDKPTAVLNYWWVWLKYTGWK